MKRSMFSAEQVVYALRQEEAGTAVEAVCRSPGVFVPWLRSVSYFQALNGANRSEPVHAGVGSGRSEGDVPCAVETQRQLGSRLRNHL